MPTRKRTKYSRLRGSHTHGWGDKKKHRNAGSKGGKGRSGSRKQKKPSLWDMGRPGKHGFISRTTAKPMPINVGAISLMIEHGKFQKAGSSYEVNLASLGYTKLLSKGAAKYPMKITVDTATEKAVAKVTEKGGSVSASNTKEE